MVELESDSWSDDSGSDKLSRSLSNNSSRTWDGISEDSSVEQDGSWLMTNKLGHLYFQYFEMASPYWRVPLTDKVILFRMHSYVITTNGLALSASSRNYKIIT